MAPLPSGAPLPHCYPTAVAINTGQESGSSFLWRRETQSKRGAYINPGLKHTAGLQVVCNDVTVASKFCSLERTYLASGIGALESQSGPARSE